MSFLSSLNPIDGSLEGNVMGAVTGGANKAVNLPGVGADSPPDPGRLVKQPDGTFLDPISHTQYKDSGLGLKAIQAPTNPQLTLQNDQTGQALTGQGTASLQGAYNGLTGLGNSYQNTINNPNAPSVAAVQQQAALGHIDADQLSQAAGVGGQNAFAARRQASQNIGNLQAQSAQQSAMLRAQEVASAQKGLGDVYTGMAGIGSTQLGTGQGYAGLATGGANTHEGNLAGTGEAAKNNATSIYNNMIGSGKKAATAGTF